MWVKILNKYYPGPYNNLNIRPLKFSECDLNIWVNCFIVWRASNRGSNMLGYRGYFICG